MKYYKIYISGLGGEVVFGKATLQQCEFWNDEDRLEEAGFDDSENALLEYMVDMETWEQNIPKTARFSREWYELNEYSHCNGCTTDSAHIIIEEVDSPEDDSAIVNTIWEGSLFELTNAHNVPSITSELDLDEEIGDNDPYVFYGMSVEKGGFFSGTLEIDNEIDLKKFKFYAESLPNGDTLLTGVDYDDTDIDNYGGDTVGKSMSMEVWEW